MQFYPGHKWLEAINDGSWRLENKIDARHRISQLLCLLSTVPSILNTGRYCSALCGKEHLNEKNSLYG